MIAAVVCDKFRGRGVFSDFILCSTHCVQCVYNGVIAAIVGKAIANRISGGKNTVDGFKGDCVFHGSDLSFSVRL